MIDPADKQTASLPLEKPKRGRGRPSTGAAMTPAQKQKAYRERLKSNVTEKNSTHKTDSIELLRNRALLRGRTCVAQARMIRDLELRIEQLKEELKSREIVTKNSKTGVTVIEKEQEKWELQVRTGTRGKWKGMGKCSSKEAAERAMDNIPASMIKPNNYYRVLKV